MTHPWQIQGVSRPADPVELLGSYASEHQVHMGAITNLAYALNASLDAASLVRAVVHHAPLFLEFERVSLAIKSSDEQTYRVWSGDRALGTVMAPEQSLDMQAGVLGWVLHQGQPVFTPDVLHDGAPVRSTPPKAARSGLALPLSYGGDVFGVMCFESAEGSLVAETAMPVACLIAAQVSTAARSVQLTGELGIADDMILSLATAIEAKDPYTQGHCDRVARYSVAVGERFMMSPRELRLLYKGAYLHDVGKIGVRDAVLLKDGPLTDEEYEHIKEHPTIGARILENLPSSRVIVPTVLYHHERWDGRGYPDGLVATESPLMARIVAVADAFDAMTTTRCYRPAMPYEQALEVLETHAGSQWDPEVVRVFLEFIRHQVSTTGSYEPND